MDDLERVLMETMQERAQDVPQNTVAPDAVIDRANRRAHRKVAVIGAVGTLVLAVGAIGLFGA